MRTRLDVACGFGDEIDDDRIAPVAHVRQLVQLGAIAPEETDVACSAVSEVHARKSCPAAENEWWLDAGQRFEDPPLNRPNLPPDETTTLPLFEQPGPKRPRVSEVPFDGGPQIGDFLWRNELQRVVRLRLAHQLADQIRACRNEGVVHDALEFIERHLHVPKEVRPAVRADEAVAWSGSEHSLG